MSSMIKLSSNPLMFKILYKNGERIDSARSATGIVGGAFHTAMEAFYETGEVDTGLKAGAEFVDEYKDAFIKFNSSYPNKQKIIDRFVFAYNSYMKEIGKSKANVLSTEERIVELIDVEWRGQRYNFPVPLKGYLDRLERDENGDLVIVDYKTCASFSDPDKIDGAKILQAVNFFFLVFAKYGEAPKKIRYEEVKVSANRDNSPQVKIYEIVYAEHDLYFDFYIRFMEDMIAMMNGEMRYLPNVYDLFDNDIAIIAYIQRLDQGDVVAARKKKEKVETLTELLRRDIERASDMRSLLKQAERSLIEAEGIDYSRMTIPEKIQTKMLEHQMLIKHVDQIEGASVTLYRFNPSIGLKMSRLKSYVEDIEQVVGKSGVRILAPIPNSTMVGVEVPKDKRDFPELPKFTKDFSVAIGKNVMGEDVRFDLRTAPHLLVAGATGSGKSVFLNSLIEQLSRVENAELVLLDPKRVELAQFKELGEYENDLGGIVSKLGELTDEMERRYKVLEKKGLRDIEGTDLPYKFVILDEFGELATVKGTDAMEKVLRLGQMARAAGIHMIIATQRPSTDIITGSVKANFPTRACFRVSSQTDSRVVLDDSGAEKLLGKGDMLFMSVEGVERLQGYKPNEN